MGVEQPDDGLKLGVFCLMVQVMKGVASGLFLTLFVQLLAQRYMEMEQALFVLFGTLGAFLVTGWTAAQGSADSMVASGWAGFLLVVIYILVYLFDYPVASALFCLVGVLFSLLGGAVARLF